MMCFSGEILYTPILLSNHKSKRSKNSQVNRFNDPILFPPPCFSFYSDLCSCNCWACIVKYRHDTGAALSISELLQGEGSTTRSAPRLTNAAARLIGRLHACNQSAWCRQVCDKSVRWHSTAQWAWHGPCRTHVARWRSRNRNRMRHSQSPLSALCQPVSGQGSVPEVWRRREGVTSPRSAPAQDTVHHILTRNATAAVWVLATYSRRYTSSFNGSLSGQEKKDCS